MDKPDSRSISRRDAALRLTLMTAGLVVAACTPQPPPAPGSYAEQVLKRKQKQRQLYEGTSNK